MFKQKPSVMRCVICNAVSNGNVETNSGDLTYKSFTEVEYGESGVPAFVCYECESSVDEVRSDYWYDDENNGIGTTWHERNGGPRSFKFGSRDD